ncbi:murein transglycosylase A [uncultured Roseobacter sp.]|uniref:murein transglycosylase A n=1 Tax=uncultured Roseobacter sp. TaxID=114847 RepID=UPI002618FA87|nr:murein transglycosylase A [uncultured Roseobacter sp.]
MTGALTALSLAAAGHGTAADVTVTALSFDALDGWAQDNHAAALAAFRTTCRDLPAPDWTAICDQAMSNPEPRAFFEGLFQPVLIEDGAPGLFTGYFEPELAGARQRGGPYQHPIYAMPPEAREVDVWHSRRDLLENGHLAERELEIAWLADPVELFFLQIQGSGRITFPDGDGLRVGYAGANGHEYRSIGAELVRRGVFEAQEITAEVIKNWVRRNPGPGQELLFHNPSYVFFRVVKDVPVQSGPLGAMNRSVTAMRSIAVDPAHTILGSPVWIEKDGQVPLRRLMVAQDTGSAIKGAQRADVFFGTGAEAGAAAGRLNDPGRMVVLLPVQRAQAVAGAVAP